MSPGVLVAPAESADRLSQSQALLNDTLTSARYAFLHPTPELHAASLELAKHYLDPLATSVSEIQQARLERARRQRKRKRNEREDYLTRDVLRLRQLHLEGFGIEQIWEQARRVIEASQREVERAVRQTEAAPRESNGQTQTDGGQSERRVRFQEEEKSSNEEDEDMEGSDGEGNSLEEAEDKEDKDIEMNGLRKDDAEEDIERDSEDNSADEEFTREQFIKDAHGLNDGFFSIDDFNRQTEFLEQRDARGDPDDGAASDEEDIDWTADPTALPVPKRSKADADDGMEDDLSEEEDNEEGPVLDDADLDAPWSGSEEDEDMDMEADMTGDDNPFANTNDIYYQDFFEPPPQPPSKKSKRRLPKTQPPPSADPEVVEEEMERTMSAARRDIFEDDSASDASDNGEARNLSSHERRQAALAAQIRKLEAEAVSQREWAMSGEARASDRPLNSLLEEDLEFERTGKPAPVATAEVSSTLEALIKQRILDRQFDEVTKRVPGSSLLDGPRAKRGLVDIEHRGPEQQSLSAMYEAEHLQQTDPNYVAPRDAKLKAAHDEITRLWSDVSAKLDALSNWHYRPKPPAVEVAVVTDAPRVLMEDARPTATAGMQAEESGLAPHEVYKAGSAREKSDAVTKGGTLLAKAELSREEKQRHHRREMERERKKAGNEAVIGGRQGAKGEKPKDGGKGRNARADAQQALAKDLKRSGVKIIAKSGEIVDVEGNKAKTKHLAKGAGSFKL